MDDAQKVKEYMDVLQHPLKAEIEVVRAIIKAADPKIMERIKWNAPSYYYKEDLLTIHVKNLKQVHLIFHNIAVVKQKSILLEGDYKDRRMLYLSSMQDIHAKENELVQIVSDLVNEMN